MKNLLRLEELVQFLACLISLIVIEAPWWTYALLLVGPDIGMVGYLVNSRVGAFAYDLLHHKALALLLGLLAPYLIQEYAFEDGTLYQLHNAFIATGIILYGHASMDRMLGYGLKYSDDFKHTHLGWIGKGPAGSEQ